MPSTISNRGRESQRAPRPKVVRVLDDTHPQWAEALKPVRADLEAMARFLAAETAAGRPYLPSPKHVLRAFQQPLEDVRVLIVGQDPYPTPGHAVGLSFSVGPHVQPLPRSLANVFTELQSDLGVGRPSNGDLTPWTRRGVLLLNRVLTVQPGRAAAHRGCGWERVTDEAVRALVARSTPLVAVLWGRDAQALGPLLGGVPQLTSAHPSPLSARRGFFGSRPFSRANEQLQAQGAEPLDWTLP
jgi:uracil-DNA glycosylase